MSDSGRAELTQTLLGFGSVGSGDASAIDRVFQIAYGELRRIASGLLRAERTDHTLQATALVHEAYLRLADDTRLQWQNRAHFFGIAARAMRQVLAEHARRRNARKRSGGWARVTLNEDLVVGGVSDVDILDLEAALTRLEAMDKRMFQIVELRFFGGLTSSETAHVLGISRRTVQQEWRIARMWLSDELAGGDR